MSDEFGDILFALVNIARFYKIDSEAALAKTNTKFLNRFQYIEEKVRASEKPFESFSLKELDEFWEEAKNRFVKQKGEGIMRLDKFLKVSRLIKRRTLAKEVSDKGRITINGIVAKASTNVKVGDELAITFGTKKITVKIEALQEAAKKKKQLICTQLSKKSVFHLKYN